MRTAIMIVDVQNDFLPGGSLAVPNGDRVVKPILSLAAKFPNAPLLLSRDWHPEHTAHFVDGGGKWPPHCVENTKGAAFHPEIAALQDLPGTYVITKGTDPASDGGYSAFDGTIDAPGAYGAHEWSVVQHLYERSIDTLIVCGLATDYCVKATVLDAVKRGFRVMLYTPGCADIDATTAMEAFEQMRDAGVLFLEDMVAR